MFLQIDLVSCPSPALLVPGHRCVAQLPCGESVAFMESLNAEPHNRIVPSLTLVALESSQTSIQHRMRDLLPLDQQRQPPSGFRVAHLVLEFRRSPPRYDKRPSDREGSNGDSTDMSPEDVDMDAGEGRWSPPIILVVFVAATPCPCITM
jgi:hypothetical protein